MSLSATRLRDAIVAALDSAYTSFSGRSTAVMAFAQAIVDELDSHLDADPSHAKVNISGDTMTGPLILSVDPTVSLGAATKQYVDTAKSAAISTAEAYADAHDATTLSTAESYADAGDAATLSTAEAYTDARALRIGNTILNSPTDKAVLYVGSSGVLAQDPTKFAWDFTNHRLGIGTASPATVLNVLGTSGIRLSGSVTTAPNDLKPGGMDVTGEDGITITTKGDVVAIINSDTTGTNYWSVHKTSINTATPNTNVKFSVRDDGFTAIGTGSRDAATMLEVGGSAAHITLSGSTSSMVLFPTTGLGAPSVSSRSAGTKLAVWTSLTGSVVDWAIGMESGAMWFSVEDSSGKWKFYGGTTAVVFLTGGGKLGLGSGASSPAGFIDVHPATSVTADIQLNSDTKNWILYNTAGLGAPSVTTRSAGTKLALWTSLTGSVVDFALGIESGAMWLSVQDSGASFKFYAGTTNILTISGGGNLTVTGELVHTGSKVGFYGHATASRSSAYTQTYSTTSRTIPAYTANAQGSAYTGIDNAQAGTPYAQLTDLNALRVAVENLRALVEGAVQVENSIIDDFQANGMFQ